MTPSQTLLLCEILSLCRQTSMDYNQFDDSKGDLYFNSHSYKKCFIKGIPCSNSRKEHWDSSGTNFVSKEKLCQEEGKSGRFFNTDRKTFTTCEKYARVH